MAIIDFMGSARKIPTKKVETENVLRLVIFPVDRFCRVFKKTAHAWTSSLIYIDKDRSKQLNVIAEQNM